MKYLLSLLVALVIADGLITQFLIKDGLARGGNPFLEPFVGETGFMALKVVGALVSALILWDIYRRYPRLATVATSCFVVSYGLIVLWNMSFFLAA